MEKRLGSLGQKRMDEVDRAMKLSLSLIDEGWTVGENLESVSPNASISLGNLKNGVTH